MRSRTFKYRFGLGFYVELHLPPGFWSFIDRVIWPILALLIAFGLYFLAESLIT